MTYASEFTPDASAPECELVHAACNGQSPGTNSVAEALGLDVPAYAVACVGPATPVVAEVGPEGSIAPPTRVLRLAGFDIIVW